MPLATETVSHDGIPTDLTPSRIDPKNMGLAMEFFTTIYSRPRDAVLRELVTNGLDAQRSNGHRGPVEVTLPTEEHPQLIVTDHGVGMSRQRLTEVFADYLESTKRDLAEAIGKFGVGCKTPAAVTDQYTVTSTHDGVTTTMLMVKQLDSTTGHKILAEESTRRPSGTTVTVPLTEADHWEWANAADRTFFWFDEGGVLVDGRPSASFHGRVHKDASTKRVKILPHSRELVVRINGVGYDIPSSMIRATSTPPPERLRLRGRQLRSADHLEVAGDHRRHGRGSGVASVRVRRMVQDRLPPCQVLDGEGRHQRGSRPGVEARPLAAQERIRPLLAASRAR